MGSVQERRDDFTMVSFHPIVSVVKKDRTQVDDVINSDTTFLLDFKFLYMT